MKLVPSSFAVQVTDYLSRLHECFTPEVVAVVKYWLRRSDKPGWMVAMFHLW